jgi:hypothetical protein
MEQNGALGMGTPERIPILDSLIMDHMGWNIEGGEENT